MRENNLERFIKAQESEFKTALAEIKSGHKRSCWMWYIFPQIQGLGSSGTAMYYAIAVSYTHLDVYKRQCMG